MATQEIIQKANSKNTRMSKIVDEVKTSEPRASEPRSNKPRTPLEPLVFTEEQVQNLSFYVNCGYYDEDIINMQTADNNDISLDYKLVPKSQIAALLAGHLKNIQQDKHLILSVMIKYEDLLLGKLVNKEICEGVPYQDTDLEVLNYLGYTKHDDKVVTKPFIYRYVIEKKGDDTNLVRKDAVKRNLHVVRIPGCSIKGLFGYDRGIFATVRDFHKISHDKIEKKKWRVLDATKACCLLILNRKADDIGLKRGKMTRNIVNAGGVLASEANKLSQASNIKVFSIGGPKSKKSKKNAEKYYEDPLDKPIVTFRISEKLQLGTFRSTEYVVNARTLLSIQEGNLYPMKEALLSILKDEKDKSEINILFAVINIAYSVATILNEQSKSGDKNMDILTNESVRALANIIENAQKTLSPITWKLLTRVAIYGSLTEIKCTEQITLEQLKI